MGDVEVHDQLIAGSEIRLMRTCEKALGTVVGRRNVQGVWLEDVDSKDLARAGSMHSNHRVSVRRPNSCGTRYGGRSGTPVHSPSIAEALRSG